MVAILHRTAVAAAFIPLALGAAPAAAQGTYLSLGALTNAALAAPMGQGLDRLHGAEPLGQGHYRFRLMNRSKNVTFPGQGRGTSFTGIYGYGLGLSSAIDLSVVIPFLMDSVGGLNKYGSGDPVLAVKWGMPGRFGSRFYRALQLSLGLPLGYKGEHALDQVGGVRTYSNESLDLGLQLMLDSHLSKLSILINGGYFRSGNPQSLPQLIYGIGAVYGRSSRWGSLNAEYLNRVALSQQSRVAATLKVGARINIYRGLELEFNREFDFQNPTRGGQTTFGLRTHGNRATGRRLEARNVLYRPQPPPKRVYAPSQVLRIAIVDFAGFEEFRAGRRLAEKIKIQLEPHDSLEVVDIRRYADVPHEGFLKPREALDMARKLNVDVVLTGAVEEFDIDRFAGPQVPYVVHLPEARVGLAMRYRVMEFSDADKSGMQSYAAAIGGSGVLRKQPRLLPTTRRDITATASAGELEMVQDRALDSLVGNLLASMASQFTWVPPDFQP